MSEDKSRSYILLAREEQQQYTSELLRENERLRASTAALESDKRRSDDQHRAALEELDRLRAQFDDVAGQNKRYAEKYHQIESHSSNLASLYVASYQLHSSVDRTTVLSAIQEIVINLIGSEEVAIFQSAAGSEELHLVSSFGVDTARLAAFRLGDGALARHLRSGTLFADDSAAGGEEKLTASIPLMIGDTIIGAILVFRLLDHKLALQPVDYELFELLAIHASTALHCATLHEAAQQAVQP